MKINKLFFYVNAMFLSLFGNKIVGAENEKPNIILILTDDLGYGDLSCQGGKDILTPNIDKLFKQGIRFSNFYSNSTVSSPTRASLITGRYPDLVGVPGVIRTKPEDNWGYLSGDAPTLPSLLKKAGYKTAIIGKWHLGLDSPNLPNERGFDFFHGFLGDMMDDYYTHLRHGQNYMRLNNNEIQPEGHATDIFTNWTIEYIKKHKNEKAKNPFFLYLAYNAPHFPIQPPTSWIDKVKKREVNISDKRATNVALVEHLDYNIGKIINVLEEKGLLNNTIIIFSSDNGGHLPSAASNGTLRGGKQDMYEGGIKVPTCFVWKKHIPSNSETSILSLTMDIYPTLCEIAGVNISHQIDGASFLPAILSKDETQFKDREVYFMRREGGVYGGLCYYCIRKGDYKLIQNTPFEDFQLYDISKDPHEENMITDKPDIFKEMRYRLSQHIQKSGSIPWQKQHSNKDK